MHELEHVAENLGTWKIEGPIHFEGHRKVVHGLSERMGEFGGHLRTREVLSRDAHGLADELFAALKEAKRTFADVFGRLRRWPSTVSRP